MEPAVSGGEQRPLSSDTGILAMVDTKPAEAIESLYDVPFVLVNRVYDEIHAEVVLSGVTEIDDDRLAAANTEAAKYGMRSYARYFGDLYEDSNVLTVLYTDDPSKGMIWGLENEVGNAWLR